MQNGYSTKEFRQHEIMSASPVRLVVLTYDFAIGLVNKRISIGPVRQLVCCVMLLTMIMAKLLWDSLVYFNGAWIASVKKIIKVQ